MFRWTTVGCGPERARMHQALPESGRYGARADTQTLSLDRSHRSGSSPDVCCARPPMTSRPPPPRARVGRPYGRHEAPGALDPLHRSVPHGSATIVVVSTLQRYSRAPSLAIVGYQRYFVVGACVTDQHVRAAAENGGRHALFRFCSTRRLCHSGHVDRGSPLFLPGSARWPRASRRGSMFASAIASFWVRD